jgi:hypothetical protein
MKATSITRVKNLYNPNYPFALVFQESTEDAAADPEAICGALVEMDDGTSYVVCVDAETNEEVIFKTIEECPNCEKERLGMKPGLVMEQQLGCGCTQVDEAYSKAWSCKSPQEPDADILKAIRKALKEGL